MPFSLPPGWYRQTVTELVRKSLPPLLGPLTPDTAWRYVYAIVMWHETVNGMPYLHLQESDKLRRQSGRDFADRGAAYLRRHLSPTPPVDPFRQVNRIGDEYAAERARQGFQPPARRDPNVTGTAFETALQVLIGEICGIVPSRTPELRTLQGFELAPTGYHSKPDLILFGPRDFRLLISTKWTLRKERIGTYLHEAYFYKNRRPDLQVAFVVSEFSPNILKWLSQDPLTDRVYHVNKAFLLHQYDPFMDLPQGDHVARDSLTASGRNTTARAYRRWLELSDRIFDLSDLFRDILRIRDAPAEVLDPEVGEDGPRGDDEGDDEG